jgi:hypothetical protein
MTAVIASTASTARFSIVLVLGNRMTAGDAGETAMDRPQPRRTIAHAALIALMIGVAMLGAGPSASAKDAQKIPDYHSAADFRYTCELLGGTYMEDGLGNTECHYSDGSWTECDANGQDCWYTPARLAPPVDGVIPSVPIVDDSKPDSDGGSATVNDDHSSTHAKHHKGQKGKKHGQHGKGRRK